MKMKPTILLTGATGFLGSSLLKSLMLNDYDVVVLKRSFSDVRRIEWALDRITYYDLDKVELYSIFEKHSFSMVLHCATDYGRKAVDSTQLVEANLILPLHLLQLTVKFNIRVFINTDTILDKRVSEYSLSKKQFVEWLKIYSDRCVCLNLALEHFYGPDDDQSKFLSYIVFQLLKQVKSIDLTAGEQKRDFIYIEDVVDAFLLIIKSLDSKKYGFSELQIGTGKTIHIKDLVERIAVLAQNNKTQLMFGALPYRKNEVMESIIDLTVIKQLGWQSKTSLLDGLKKTIDYEREKLKICDI